MRSLLMLRDGIILPFLCVIFAVFNQDKKKAHFEGSHLRYFKGETASADRAWGINFEFILVAWRIKKSNIIFYHTMFSISATYT